MLDIGMLEIFVIGALALIVVGPKELPGLLRTVGQFVAKARGMAREFQSSMEAAAREADLDGVVNSVKSGNKLPFDNQIVDTMKEFEKSVKTETSSTDAPEAKVETPAPVAKAEAPAAKEKSA
jgi:sec-independent protein translocase protein TatB